MKLKKAPKIFLKDSEFSKASMVLVAGWMVILLWFVVTDFPFMQDWPLLDIFAIPFLALLSGYYIGKYNLKQFVSDSQQVWKNYQSNR